MTATAKFNALPLLAVKPALDASLEKIGSALDQYFASNGENKESLQEAIEELHRAYGVLRMLSLQGVIVFCGELENLLQEFSNGSLQAAAMHQEIIQRALLILTHFLGALADGAPNAALRLFDPYQELLQARGIEAAFEVDLFFPELNVVLPQAVLDQPQAADAPAGIKAARSQYQQALLKWLRQDHAADALQSMHAAVQQAMTCVAPDKRTFWWVASGLLDCLIYDGLPPELNAKKLLGRIDLQMKALVEAGAGDERAILTEMLYLLARSHAVSETVDEIKRRFALDTYLPEVAPLAPGETAQVLEQMGPLLNGAKETWERCMAEDAACQVFAEQAEQLYALSEQLDRNTLQLLCKQIQTAAAQTSDADYRRHVMMNMAIALMLLESGIAYYSHLGNNFHEQVRIVGLRLQPATVEAIGEQEAQLLVQLHAEMAQREIFPLLAEAMGANLEQVEQELNAFFATPDKRGDLPGMARLLGQVQGCLHMLCLEAAETLVRHARQAVVRYAEGGNPEGLERDTVVSAISALGAYVHDLTYGQKLDSAPLQGLLQEITSGVKAAPVTAPVQEQAAAPATGIVAQVPDSGDNEMLEVFLEEAQEVLGILRSNLELSQLHPDSNEPLVTMRRGFHTLKGSGRMVGLNDFGEVAWAVERAMNKWLQESKHATPALLQFIADAEVLFHAWVDALRSRSGTVLDPAPLIAAAKLVESGELPEEVPQAATQGMPDMQDVIASTGPSTDESTEASQPALPSMAFETMVIPRGQMAFSAQGDESVTGPEAPAAAHPFAMPDMQDIMASVAPVAADQISEASLLVPELSLDTAVSMPVAEQGQVETEEGSAVAALAFAMPDMQDILTGSAPAQDDDKPLQVPELSLDASVMMPTERVVREEISSAESAFALPDMQDILAAAAIEPEPQAAEELAASLNIPELAHDLELAGFAVPENDKPQAEDIPSEHFSAPALDELQEEPVLPDLRNILPASLSMVEPEPEASPVAIQSVGAREAEAEADTVKVGSITLSSSLFEIASEESASNLSKLQLGLAEMRASDPPGISHDFMRAAHTLAGVNRTMGFGTVADLARALELWLEPRISKPFTLNAEQIDMVEQTIAMLDAMFLDICNRQEPQAEPQLIARLQADQELLGAAIELPASGAEPAPDEMPKAVWGAAPLEKPEPALANEVVPQNAAVQDLKLPMAGVTEPAELAKPAASSVLTVQQDSAAHVKSAVQPQSAATPQRAVEPQQATESGQRVRQFVEERAVQDDIDEELLPIFLEESVDLQPQVVNGLRAWRANPEAAGPAADLQRVLHTLKGSARMAGVMRLGELVHRMEDRVIAAAKGRREEGLWEELDSYSDRIGNALDRLRSGERGAEVAVEAAPAAAPAAIEPTAQPQALLAAVEPQAEQAVQPHKQEASAERAAAMLRVRSDTVDRLVNEAGEISVARSRIDAELRNIKGGLAEMAESVAHLRKQLREIEIQAESQMEARVALAKETHEQFDPLEFDRFTRFQELTRFMGESVHDVQTVQQSLLKNLDEVASAMSAQAYLNRSLQQSLMAIRMVPFSGLGNRLYRVVRQSAKEMNKRANLDIRGGEVELDRSVLDRMTAPFEHLLRNSIAHGIELPEERNRANKAAIGQIYIALRQESNEVVFEVGDDGAGINLDRLRMKVVEAGLFPSAAAISDEEAMLLIFSAGISTASEVTEISGRGVGMDVVRNEIVALGGQISVHSERGKGTRFIIRLPLTLAVAQILMIRAGQDFYALPSVMVEQVLHLKPDVLQTSYLIGQVSWQGTAYPLRYLPRLLGNEEQQPESRLHNPVLLLRSGDQRMALHVDELHGNQETVVKNIGPQLARLPGVVGATVTSSGRVVLILNPVALTQRVVAATVAAPAPQAAQQEEVATASAPHAVPIVMVVDDSLTVRKVSSRMLTRAGYEVVTAKDGVDALEQLTQVKPAVMLLDVEMPRMDGFELTRQVRRDPKLHDIPILMITSRTAEKHRDYALELGVNAYFGKPFQEEELLQQIANYTGHSGR